MVGLLSPVSCLGVFASLHLPPKPCLLYRVAWCRARPTERKRKGEAVAL